MNRRSALGLIGVGAAFAAVPTLLSGCSTTGASTVSATGVAAQVARAIPSYIPLDLVKPDIPGVNGSTPGFTKLPSKFVRSVPGTPGSGGKYTVMSPAWWSTPPALGSNQYYAAVNKALGATIKFQVNDGNTYGDKLQAVLASPGSIADWVVIPSWNIPPRFVDGVGALFTDLTPYLSGDKIKKYPNLANISSDAWKYCAFDGKIYGLPYPGELVSNAFFYRKDLFDKAGIAPPTSADEYIKVAKQITDPAKGRWGSEDPWTGAQLMFGTVAWQQKDGKLQNRIETDEYREALEWIRKLFASGAVHPDAVEGNNAGGKTRFEGGKSWMTVDGVGAWHESLSRVLPTNPSFNPQPMDFFGPDGGKPTLWKDAPVSIFSFIKKTTNKAQIEEMLAIANYVAAPFGTTENMLINYGVEGVHYTLNSQNIPQVTSKGSSDITSTYAFLVRANSVNSMVQHKGFVADYCNWMARQAKYVKNPLFYGIQIQEPAKYSALSAPFTDLEANIARGRKPVSALDDAVATWKRNGGDKLRAFYEDNYLKSSGK